jgi:hypothetical protein
MKGEKMKNRKLRPDFQQKIITIGTIGSIPFVFLFVWIYLYHPPSYQVVSLLGILLGVEGIIMGIVFYEQRKEVKKVNKGRKIFEIEQRGYEVLPKLFVYLFIILSCFLIVGVTLSVIEGKFYLLPLFIVVIANIMIISLKRKIEIYEKGIKYGLIFIGWNEVEGVKWENRILKIKTNKVIGEIQIKDENEEIKEIIKKYLKKAT